MGLDSLPTETGVLVVGGGPVGLVAAILLTGLGIDTVVVERREGPQEAPAAHVVNARTFEILRAAGVDMDAIEAACRPPSDGWVRWSTALDGVDIGVVPFEGQDRIDSLYDVTPTPLRNLSQHRLEPILRTHVDGLVGGVEWVSSVEDGDGVTSTLRDVASGESTTVRSRWLIGADGGRSSVRRAVGIEMNGPDRLQAFVNIHVEADLRHLVGDRPATLYWMADPSIGGVYVAHDIDGTWSYMHPWDPTTETIADYTPERCEALFRRGILGDTGPLVVRTIAPWSMSCQVATTYRSGRTLLIGDAAHRFPPTGGMGLNTGVVDAQNLAWKLALVERGVGLAEPLLDSYDAERRPIASANADQSLRNAFKLIEVARALGADPDPVVSKAHYDQAIANEEALAAARLAAEGQAEHFDMIGLQLGFTYQAESGFVVDDGTPSDLPDDAVRDYSPSTRPGGRLPHAWVTRDGVRISTLDLVPLDRFVLITASPAWADAARSVQAQLHEPLLEVILVGVDVIDTDGSWMSVAGLGDIAAILVRPDQHVGWRAAIVGDDPAGAIRAALDRLIGHPAPTAAA